MGFHTLSCLKAVRPYGGNSASLFCVVDRVGTAGGSAAPVDENSVPRFISTLSPPKTPAAPETSDTWEAPDTPRWLMSLSGRNTAFMDKLKSVLSGQDDGTADGSGILEVLLASC